MSNATTKRFDTRTLVGVALLTAIVVVLQLLGSFIRFGTFSISLVLMPIVVGAALFGVWAGAWLGLVFAVVVLLQPDTMFFFNISPAGTIITVILKGVLCGACAGLVYKLLSKKFNTTVGVIAAAAVAPIVNTGIFLIGCRVFFWDTIKELASATKYADNATLYLIVFFVGLNFVFELIVNLVLSPAIVTLIRYGEKSFRKK